MIYHETWSDQIPRVIDLPGAVDPKGASATLKDGLLELEMPEATPVKKVPIEAKTAWHAHQNVVTRA